MRDIVGLGKKRVRILAGLMATFVVTAAGSQGGAWEIGTIDDVPGGSYSSLQIDKLGNAHVAHVSDSQGVLQYSFWDHNLRRWFTTKVDYATGFCSLALDSHQRPHISYPNNGKLKYAYWDGTAWQKQTIPLAAKDVTYYTSLALDSEDRPSISFYEMVAGSGELLIRMRVVTFNGRYWELTTVDATRGSGKFNSIAIDSAGNPQLAYADVSYENASLRYARWDGEKWNVEILEGAGAPGTYRQAVMLILDPKDNPHIAYSDALNNIVKYATGVNGKWQIQSVDSIGRVAYPDRNGMALDDHGNPYISYYDGAAGVLKIAYRKNQKWFSEVVDSGFAGFTSSLQIHGGMIWLTYASEDREHLKVARRRIEPLDSETSSSNAAISK